MAGWERSQAEDGSPQLVNDGDSIGVDPDGDVVVTIGGKGRPVWTYLPFEALEAFVRDERARRAAGRFQRPMPVRGPGNETEGP
jgi:hypothetical protein